MLDFPNYFVALRNRMENTLESAFHTVRDTEICGRLTALHAWFDHYAEAKLFGLIPAGSAVEHSHEHRLLFSTSPLTLDTLEIWWHYAQQVQQTLVHPDSTHQFTLISLILVCPSADARALRRLRRLDSCCHYVDAGWSDIRLAVICAQTGKITCNRAGAPLVNRLKPILR